MLRRQDDLRRRHRLAIDIFDRHLALRIGPELRGVALPEPAFARQSLENLMRIIDRRRHQLGGLATGIAEHDALIAGTLVLIARGIDTLRDIGRLGMQQNFDIGILPMEARLLIADVLDRLPGCLFERGDGDRWAADFAGNDDPVRRRQSLTCDSDLIGVEACLRPFPEKEIDDLVGHPIANLVRMTFGHGLTREKIILARHR